MKPSALVLTALLGLTLLPQSTDAATYAIDSGTAALALGETQEAWSAAALNHFTAVAGSQNIVSISVVFGTSTGPTNLVGGEAFTVGIWSDPNGDGNPGDARLIGSATGSISIYNDGHTFQTTAIPTVSLTPGQSFFAGAFVQDYHNAVFPLGVSAGNSPTESWAALAVFGTIDPNDLASANVLARIQDLPSLEGAPMVAMIRANGVPEPTTAAFAGMAALALLRRRRR